MLQSGEAPPPFQQPPAPALPMLISHPLVRPRRAAAVRTNAAIDASLRAEAQTTRLGRMKKISDRLAFICQCPLTPLAPFGSEIPQRTHLRPSVYMWTMCSLVGVW